MESKWIYLIYNNKLIITTKQQQNDTGLKPSGDLNIKKQNTIATAHNCWLNSNNKDLIGGN